jgi:GAF domain-containing protein
MDDLVRYFADLATTLLSLRSIDDTMAVIVASAVETIDGCEHASLSYLRGRELVSASSSDEVGPILDRIQTETGQGPCLDALRSGEVRVSSDLAHDSGYAIYGPRAGAETGVRSSIASPLHVGTRVIGALDLFSKERATFDVRDDTHTALIAILVAHSAPALAAALERADFAAALRSRDLIGQAKGMLRAASDLTEDEAFAVLIRASQRLNVKIVEIARQIVDREPTERRPLPPRSATD